MKPLHRILRPLIYAATILAVVFVLRHLDAPDSVREYRRDFGLFGTYGRVTFWAAPRNAEAAADEIQRNLTRLHDTLNLYDEQSELSRLNRTAFDHPFKCSPTLWRALDAAREAYRITDGAFDISIGALMDVWGFHSERDTYPADEEVKRALAACGLDNIVFDDVARTVKFTHPETRLDFGGIAKGYALDIARRIAREHGIRRGIIDLGGNVYSFPEPPPDKDAYTVGIRNPFSANELMKAVEVRDRAVATSGNYENYRYIDDKFVHHILDPETGYPVERTASVTCIAPTGLLSDVGSTAIFVRGAPLAERLRDQAAGVAALMVQRREDGEARILSFGWPAEYGTVP